MSDSPLAAFSHATRGWFTDNYAQPTRVQARGWPVIASGRHALLTAPTGSGKTLAAFLWALDRLGTRPVDQPGIQVVYLSPLKALVHDIERNLRAPLMGIQRTAERLGEAFHLPDVAIRTGDTPQRERQAQLRAPSEILVTTPESLFLLLTSRMAGHFRSVHTIIIDEVHALLPSKRGAHLALSLERLSALAETEPQRIGLTATVKPLSEAAGFVGGDRPVEIVDCAERPKLAVRVKVPVPDMERIPIPPKPGGSILAEGLVEDRPGRDQERGIWAAVHPALLAEIRAHTSTIIFVNSRGLCERLAQALNELADEALVLAHHGSVSHERRAAIEEALKAGTLRGIVATSSLELGIDMGAVDQVILVESPGSVARGLQRAGRAGHGPDQISKASLFPKFRGDLLESAVVAAHMDRGDIETSQAPRNALDVLAQQVTAMVVAADKFEKSDLLTRIRRAWPYRELTEAALDAVLEMLSGGYAGGEFAELRPLLNWDRASDGLSPRKGSPMVVRLNAGTIPDRGLYAVHLGEDGPRLGELDEEMVYETRAGEHIRLGANIWKVEQITRDRVIVSPGSPEEPARLPFWKGDGPGRPVELGRALGEFVRQIGDLGRAKAESWLAEHTPLDELARRNLLNYLSEQHEHCGCLPTDQRITVERFRDELGDWRVCVLSPFGARIHGPWAMVLKRRLEQSVGFEVQVMYTDDGLVMRFADGDDLPELSELLPDPDEVEDQLTEVLAGSALFAGLFRENAARALLLPKRSGKGRQPLWAQRLKAQSLLATVQRYPGFPIVLETYRQILAEVFDIAGFKALLRDIRSRKIRVDEVETGSASPFSRSLVIAYVGAFLYEQDAPLAERRAQALSLERNLLADLLGQAELRNLIDADVLMRLEAELQHLSPERQARNADALHDLLRRLGDLSTGEIEQRCAAAPGQWLAELARQRQAIEIRISGEPRWIAAEDAGLYRDALGSVPPGGLPEAFIAPVERPLELLLRRYARTHGPFGVGEPARRWGFGNRSVKPEHSLCPRERAGVRVESSIAAAAILEPALRLLESEGVLARGEMRPQGQGIEWCDAEILRRLRRRTLAGLRHQVAPVEGAALARFLSEWHGVGQATPRVGEARGRLLDVIDQLEGMALPWTALSVALLPARVPNFRLDDLDMLAATGEIVWVGRGALGPKDGRIALYRRSRVAALIPASDGEFEPRAEHQVILDRLKESGACFLFELEEAFHALDKPAQTLESSLWDLVWAGLISNDTFAPLRQLSGPRRSGSKRIANLAGGRWSLVEQLSKHGPEPTEARLMQVETLLNRYGVVSREAVLSEGLPGGFGPLYQVLKQMEETGRVRRGYFVEGLSGAQFARAGVIDRLRGARPGEMPVDGCSDEDVTLLAAIDPANPYGALLPWPAIPGSGVPKRVVGAGVVLVAGRPMLWLGANGQQLLVFGSDVLDDASLVLALRHLHKLPGRWRRRSVLVKKVNGSEALASVFRPAMEEAGFSADYGGMRWQPMY